MFNIDKSQANSLMNHVKSAAKSLHSFVKPYAKKIHEVTEAIDTPVTYGLVSAVAGPEALPVAMAAIKTAKVASKYLKGDQIDIKDIPKDAMELVDAKNRLRKNS